MCKASVRLLLFFSLQLVASLAQAETLRISAITAPGTPWYDSWDHFRDQLARRPELELEPRFYLLGQLGSEESALSQLRRGRVQMGGFSLQGASAVVPELGVLMSPYLFSSFEEVDHVMDHHLLQAFDELFADKGLVLLAWAEVGWTNLYSTLPLASPLDSAGLKLRSSNALASQLLVRAIGADAVPMAFPDIMPSLQTGLIQGGESGSILYALAGLPAEAPWLIQTRHAFDSGMYLANRAWFESLDAEQRSHLRASLMPAVAFRKEIRAVERGILDEPEKLGIKLLQPDAAQLQAWREATAGNQGSLVGAIGGRSEEILAIVNAGKAAFRSGPSAHPEK